MSNNDVSDMISESVFYLIKLVDKIEKQNWYLKRSNLL